MSIGSTTGERRGGRQPGTPNRKTAERMALQSAAMHLIAAADRPAHRIKSHTGAQVEPDDPDAAWDRQSFDGTALLFLQLTYRDPRFIHGVRMDAAKAAIRFESPALQAMTLAGDAENPVTLRTIDARTPLDGRMTALLLAAQVPVTTHDVDDAGETTHTITE